MPASVSIVLLAIVLFLFLLLYKKDMIVKMFMLKMSAPANEFTAQLEQTADAIIRRLEEEAAQLELLLEEAETKIGLLNQQVEQANKMIEQLSALVEKQSIAKQQDTGLVVAEIGNASVLPVAEDVLPEPVQPIAELAIEAEENKHTIKEVNVEKYRHIIAMADQNYTVTEIAKATGMGKGEIMLLLQLNKK
ncbi:hypothetical protein SOV_18670 [Sporomusa ovata DSM 2662]|uniref:Uncharacterized protein n=1 Tax=Sporomusa ovata TaxID=2378 RepID=A0A0U1KW55_9FIRM|nr:hypothetical protein [Sporomusa ovata]EQB29465.1 hypothetical protein SOV_1c11990 [Sporomusa ovata DSM 2662]CQR71515.1 hypothetical protein SpAn4DRAFT_4020 [Sporomusa ovata]